MWTIDAHCHLSDERLFATAADYVKLQAKTNIRGFLLGGVDPADWSRQAQLKSESPGTFFTCYGLHPYFVGRSDEKTLQLALTELKKLLPSATAAGEMGLDLRSQYSANGLKHQKKWFSEQLDLAQELKKPVVLHIVRAHDPALKILEECKPIRGMVHAFNSSAKVGMRYIDLGLHLSIGAGILHELAEPLREAVQKAPLERLLIESDAPDQPPPGQTTHDSSTVWLVARKIAELRNEPVEKIVEKTRQNLADITGIPV